MIHLDGHKDHRHRSVILISSCVSEPLMGLSVYDFIMFLQCLYLLTNLFFVHGNALEGRNQD